MLNDIIALNNRAISFLQQGNRDMDVKAVGYLREALCRLRKRVNHLKENDGENKLSSARNSACDRFSRRPIKRRIRPRATVSSDSEGAENSNNSSIEIRKVPITKTKCQEKQPSSSDSENLFSFYQHAFMLCPTTTGTISTSKKLNNQVYIVLLYNIGLALHMEGIGNDHNSKGNLTKAMQFYELAMSMIAIEWRDIDPDDLLLLLAVSNNLGHIHSYLLNFTETQKYLVWLRHLMKAYQQYNKRGSVISDKDYSFFCTNSLFLEDVGGLCCAPTA